LVGDASFELAIPAVLELWSMLTLTKPLFAENFHVHNHLPGWLS